MQKSQAARKNAKQDKTMLGRMQRAADRIKEAREEMSELETMLGRNIYVTTDMLCVHETLSDGLQALQRMMDGDGRNEYEQLHAEYKRRDDKLEAAGDLIMGAAGQLQRAAELFGECCDEAGWVCDDPNVPNTEEITRLRWHRPQTCGARCWVECSGMLTGLTGSKKQIDTTINWTKLLRRMKN